MILCEWSGESELHIQEMSLYCINLIDWICVTENTWQASNFIIVQISTLDLHEKKPHLAREGEPVSMIMAVVVEV